MSSNAPGSTKYYQQFPPMDSSDINLRSPPKTKRTVRKSTEIERTLDRSDGSNNNTATNSVTPGTAEHSNSR